MAGYNYLIVKKGHLTATETSPVLEFHTFKRFAKEAYDTLVANRKKASYKLGDVVEYELPSFEQCGDERQVMKECSGKDKNGNEVTFVLERFHVGGQAKERGIAVGGPVAKKARGKKAS